MHDVIHTDVRDANVLWDEDAQRATVIDFEQAVLVERPRPVLAPIVPNKRARQAGVDATNTTASKPRSRSDVIRFKMQEDILYAKLIFEDKPPAARCYFYSTYLF